MDKLTEATYLIITAGNPEAFKVISGMLAGVSVGVIIAEHPETKLAVPVAFVPTEEAMAHLTFPDQGYGLSVNEGLK